MVHKLIPNKSLKAIDKWMNGLEINVRLLHYHISISISEYGPEACELILWAAIHNCITVYFLWFQNIDTNNWVCNEWADYWTIYLKKCNIWAKATSQSHGRQLNEMQQNSIIWKENKMQWHVIFCEKLYCRRGLSINY